MKSKQGMQKKKTDKKVKGIKASQRNQDPEEDPSTSEEEMEVSKSMKKDSGFTKKSAKVKEILREKQVQEESSDEDEDRDESEEEEDDDNEESEDDDEENSDADDSDEDDDEKDSDEEDDDDDSDEDDDKEEGDTKPGQKRKAKQPVKNENKKAKLETSNFSGIKTLFIRMMSSDVESSTIEKFFDSHGVKVQHVRRIVGRNFAYVDVSESQLEAALALSGKKMAGKQVQILLANEKSEKTRETKEKTKSDAESKKNTLFVKNLGFNVKDADIKAHFPLAKKIFAPRKMDGKLKGHGHLEFESEEIAEKVMTELQNSTLCGRSLCLDYVGDKRQDTTPQKQPEENCKTLCVKQLNYKTTSEQLKAFFKKATEARIVKDVNTDKSRGFGFVVFESHEHAAKALQHMQGKDLNGRNVVVSYALKKKSRPGKTKQDRKSKKFSRKGSGDVKGRKPTKNRPANKLKATNNRLKKTAGGDS